MKTCYHCDQVVTGNVNIQMHILGQARDLCCVGCEAVAGAIIQSGSESFYQYRTDASETPELTPAELPEFISNELILYDNPTVLADITESSSSQTTFTLSLIIDGITCAACGWLIEKEIKRFAGIESVNLNLSQHRLHLSWDQTKTPLSKIISRIYQIGFKAHPYTPDKAQLHLEEEQRLAIRRLVLAAFGTMQAMMFALPLYVGDWAGIFEKFETYFRYASLAIATPVVLFSARPFFVACIRDIKTRHLTMDVPVSIAIGGAYLASIWSTFTGGQEVYFDSVCMFTFFLLIGRFLEARTRLRFGQAGNNLNTLLPRSCTRIDPTTKLETVIPVSELNVGDIIRVLPGTTIPADGLIASGTSSIDESIITGEFVPIAKAMGDAVISGSLNVESPFELRITALGNDTQLSTVMSLLDRAATQKPKMALLADNIAQYFVATVLIISAIVFTSWTFIDSDKAFWITLSVLVATCPCALSLATPTALTAASGALRKAGVLITRGHVLENIIKSQRVIFDKTGTLTLGKLSIEKIIALNGNQQTAINIASCLEAQSQHPIASAFKFHSKNNSKNISSLAAQNVLVEPGQGLSGDVDNVNYRLGNLDYAMAKLSSPDDSNTGDSHAQTKPDNGHWILLADEQQAIAWFLLSDQIRPMAKETCSQLNDMGLTTEMLSGDQSHQVQSVATAVGINKAQGGITPEGKLDYLSSIDPSNMSIMVGDGINDVPVLAKAPISIAIGSASDLAKTHADVILVGNQLQHLPQLILQARSTSRIIKQNLIWALLYNASVLPLAAFGLLPPWAAAIGMSFSSLVVVFNALRLNKLPVVK
jgi:Cu2+-exporting ATPase